MEAGRRPCGRPGFSRSASLVTRMPRKPSRGTSAGSCHPGRGDRRAQRLRIGPVRREAARQDRVVELPEVLAEHGALSTGLAHDAFERLDGQILFAPAMGVRVNRHRGRARTDSTRSGQPVEAPVPLSGYPTGRPEQKFKWPPRAPLGAGTASGRSGNQRQCASSRDSARATPPGSAGGTRPSPWVGGSTTFDRSVAFDTASQNTSSRLRSTELSRFR